jgi:hypothetical protein
VDVSFKVLTESFGWAPDLKLCVIELMTDKFAGDDFVPDMTNEIL